MLGLLKQIPFQQADTAQASSSECTTKPFPSSMKEKTFCGVFRNLCLRVHSSVASCQSLWRQAFAGRACKVICIANSAFSPCCHTSLQHMGCLHESCLVLDSSAASLKMGLFIYDNRKSTYTRFIYRNNQIVMSGKNSLGSECFITCLV